MTAKNKRIKKRAAPAKDCASPLMRRNLDALGRALGAAMAEDLKESKKQT
jgi:hypothetical protein